MKHIVLILVLLAATLAHAQQWKITLSWHPAADQTDPAVSYNVYRSTNGGAFVEIAAGLTAVSYVDATTQNTVAYAYYVTSVDAAGNESVPSNTWRGRMPGQTASTSLMMARR